MISPELLLGISFVVFIAVECWLSMRMELHNYEAADSLANGAIAVAGAILNILFKGVAFGWFVFVHQATPFKIENGWFSLLILFLLTDLFYYVFHRLGHRSRFFWASHVIHHSSEKFNLTTSLRSPITNSWFRFLFSTPLPLLGFEPAMVVLMDSVVLVYTFFIHTELVNKLGVLEYFLNTPSHHRVHHGSNAQYIDKNYGAVFIIWDKLFGTFQAEVEKPVYGLTKQIRSNNPFKIVFHEWVGMVRDLVNSKTSHERFQYFFGAPGWSSIAVVKPYSPRTFRIVARIIGLLLLSGVPFTGYSQSANDWVAQGRLLEASHQDEKALVCYEAALKQEPANVPVLVRSARMLCNIGGRSKDKEFKRLHAAKAKAISLQAIALDKRNTEAHLNYTLALGMLSEMADSPREKLESARIIRTEIDIILSIDPQYAPAYYILGKWHYALASLNGFERWMCKLLFGGMPEGASMKEAVRCYDKAIQLWPDYILFHYSIAMSWHSLGEERKAVAALEKALVLPLKDLEDPGRLVKCRKLLNEIQITL